MKQSIKVEVIGARLFIPLCLQFLFASPTFGQVIPSTRVAPWQGNVGIPGGIPNRTLIYTTIPAGASTATIQATLNACPSNNVVMLSAGTYTVTDHIRIPSYVTLRGAGPGKTILQLSGSFGQPNCGIYFGLGYDSYGANLSFVSGATQGSTSLTLSSTVGVGLGTYLMVTCNDPSYVNHVGGAGGGQGVYAAPWPAGGNVGNIGQIIEVTSVAGNTIGFNPPLFIDYSNGGQALVNNTACRWAGTEDLTVRGGGAGVANNYWFYQSAYCWLRNVESDKPDRQQCESHACFRCEVRDSYFHDGLTHSPGVDDTCLVNFKSTGMLWENNIFLRLHPAVMLQGGPAGNVFGYNFCTNNYGDGGDTFVYAMFDFHGCHPAFNLFEGNVGSQIFGDAYWGSSSHNTAFRNWLSCSDYAPAGYWCSAGVWGIVCSWAAPYWNAVGNVIGSSYVKSHGGVTECDWSSPRANVACLMFGYDSAGDGGAYSRDSTTARTTAIVEGNWDVVSAQQHWSAGAQALPNSYYLSSKPTYFGNLPWPPIDPANGAGFSATNIPAGYKFYLGAAPPAGLPDTNAPTITQQPQSQSIAVGQSATFNITATGSSLGYRWTFNGQNVSGVGSSFTKTNCQTNDSGNYRVVVTNRYGSATSSIAVLTVTNALPWVTNGLVVALGFEGGPGSAIVDSSHYQNSGNATNIAWTTGKYGKALLFNASNSIVAIPPNSSLELGSALTLETWVYPKTTTGWMNLIYHPNGSSAVTYVLNGSSGAQLLPSVYISPGSSNLMAPAALPLNTWTHLAATYDGTSVRLYTNGVLVASQPQTGVIATSADGLSIGGNVFGNESWSGVIDEVRIYNRALGASEIQRDMNTPVSQNGPPGTSITGIN